jgi:hypothetical protein
MLVTTHNSGSHGFLGGFKPPFTLKIFHAPPPSTILGNQVTSCNK